MNAAKEQILVATNTQAQTEKTINDLKQALADKSNSSKTEPKGSGHQGRDRKNDHRSQTDPGR
jgi:hypothetical protein